MNHILLTVDVEDWFQVENFKKYIPFSSWSSHELRVEKNTHRILDLFDSFGFEQSAISYEPHKKVRCTFFVLGWLAERLPNLVREIHSRGHEVASHGYCHNLCVECSSHELKRDLTDSKRLLEDIIGDRVYGYRAPSFSINDDILRSIEDGGYLYDSSYNSFGLHGRYGKLNLNGDGAQGISYKISDKFYELPISNLHIINPINYQLSAMTSGRNIKDHFVLPWGGGGYFRLIPAWFFILGVRSILKKDKAYVFYIHPWEIDDEQPRVNNASVLCKFRHYINLGKCSSKLSILIESFSKCHFVTCYRYITESTE